MNTRDERLVQRLIAGTYFDPLTRLFNRRTFVEGVEVALARLGPGQRAAVVHLDIDGFARFNQVLSMRVGDLVLVELAARLRAVVLPSDMVARSGDDEFLALLTEPPNGPPLEQRLARLARALQMPLQVERHELALSLSCGAAILPDHAHDAEALIARAGLALDASQTAGGGALVLYDRAFADQAQAALALSQRLGRGGVEAELGLVFEPIVGCASGRVGAAEALVRWHPPGRRPVPPSTFIPLAEANGAIVAIGRCVLERALAALAGWRRHGARELAVTVNVSARELQAPDFAASVEAAVARHGLGLDALVLELTETAAVADVALARCATDRLVAGGARLAIDDFGTGNATLATLQDLPVSIIKIDRRFVARAPTDRRSRQLVAASVAIAKSLDMTTVAEGIETPDQLAVVRDLGCDAAQGFIFTRSLDVDAFTRRFVGAEVVPALADS